MASRAGGSKPPDKLAILGSHPLFGQLGVDALNRLASYSHTKAVSAGTTIFESKSATNPPTARTPFST
jgi:hypothetical protein